MSTNGIAAEASGGRSTRLLEAQLFKLGSKHHQDLLDTAAREDKKTADSVSEFIELWNNTHKEVLFLDCAIKRAEEEHQMLLLAVWAAGPQSSAEAEKTLLLQVEAMKKRVQDLKATNGIEPGVLLELIIKDSWHFELKIAKKAKAKAMALSAAEWPRSWTLLAANGINDFLN